MKHLLVTNDYPPKLGGIQSYLWELWRRLPPESVTVLTTPHPDSGGWDATQPYPIERVSQPVLLPTPSLRRRIDDLAARAGAEMIVLDPALPVGALGPHLSRPYAVVLHGAEVTVPGRLPGSRQALARVVGGADLVIAAGGYPLAEAERAVGRSLPGIVIPPGVDVERFRPLDPSARRLARERLGLPLDRTLVLGLSRLVPRKGFDVLIEAVARLAHTRPEVEVVIAGSGRDRDRLEKLAARTAAPVRFLGRVPDDDLPDLYGSVDVFAMLCRNRWAGLEQEGFGIVFLEAAAAGVPQIAGRSGGADEAVVHGETGLVVDPPTDVDAVARAVELLVSEPARRDDMACRGRARVERDLTYTELARRLGDALGVDR